MKVRFYKKLEIFRPQELRRFLYRKTPVIHSVKGYEPLKSYSWKRRTLYIYLDGNIAWILRIALRSRRIEKALAYHRMWNVIERRVTIKPLKFLIR